MSKTNLLNSIIMGNVDDCFLDYITACYGVWYADSIQTPEWNFLSKLGNVENFINFVWNSICKELHQRFGDNFEETQKKMTVEEAFDICTQIADNSLLKLSNMSDIRKFILAIAGDAQVFVTPGLLD